MRGGDPETCGRAEAVPMVSTDFKSIAKNIENGTERALDLESARPGYKS